MFVQTYLGGVFVDTDLPNKEGCKIQQQVDYQIIEAPPNFECAKTKSGTYIVNSTYLDTFKQEHRLN